MGQATIPSIRWTKTVGQRFGFLCDLGFSWSKSFSDSPHSSAAEMPIHTLESRQVIPVALDTAWEFFSNPRNLERITPPDLGFKITTLDLPPRIHAGMMIQYQVNALPGIPMTWLTEITHVREGEYFVDEQRVGPYALWHHEHHFADLGNGRVEMRDRVTYRLPLQPLGELAHAWLVQPRLKRIFEYRQLRVSAMFP